MACWKVRVEELTERLSERAEAEEWREREGEDEGGGE